MAKIMEVTKEFDYFDRWSKKKKEKEREKEVEEARLDKRLGVIYP